ncbi:hypothetical protein ACFV42_35585 [Streptomyces solisilvae]|uniref:hypothetical protein n=1 Tax=Streptomyces malaysiensis TaxID=92644 RepID=UPI003696F0F2
MTEINEIAERVAGRRAELDEEEKLLAERLDAGPCRTRGTRGGHARVGADAHELDAEMPSAQAKTAQVGGHAGFPVYQCRLPVPRRANEYCADLLTRHLKKIGSRWRALPPGQIVIIVLAVLRHDQRIADMVGGNAVGDTTVRRWRDELISLLAAQAPHWTAHARRSPDGVVRSS